MSGKAIVLNPSLMTCDNQNDYDPDENINLSVIPADRGSLFVNVEGRRTESVTVKQTQGQQANTVSLTPFILLTILFHVLAIWLVMHLWQHDRGMTRQFFQTQRKGLTVEKMIAGAQSDEHTLQSKSVMKAYFIQQRPSNDVASQRSNERPDKVEVEEISLSGLPLKSEQPHPKPINAQQQMPTSLKSMSLKSQPLVSKSDEHSEDKTEHMLHAASRPSLNDNNVGGADTDIASITNGYLLRQRQQALDELVLSSAQQYTQQQFYAQGTAHYGPSELTPDMEVIVVPNANDISEPSSLDLSLDPNRIVRQGQTCYRVVNVGTQVNPYAENLGFPFDCSGEKINQAIHDAIQARLKKMHKHISK